MLGVAIDITLQLDHTTPNLMTLAQHNNFAYELCTAVQTSFEMMGSTDAGTGTGAGAGVTTTTGDVPLSKGLNQVSGKCMWVGLSHVSTSLDSSGTGRDTQGNVPSLEASLNPSAARDTHANAPSLEASLNLRYDSARQASTHHGRLSAPSAVAGIEQEFARSANFARIRIELSDLLGEISKKHVSVTRVVLVDYGNDQDGDTAACQPHSMHQNGASSGFEMCLC